MSYEQIRTENQARELLGKLGSTPGPYGLDTETVGVDPTAESPCGVGRIHCWSIAINGTRSRCIKGVGTIKEANGYYIEGKLLHMFEQWLESAPVVGHNIHGFDRHIFANHGIELRNIVGDTRRMFRLLHPGKEHKGDLKSLGRFWLGIQQPSFDSITRRPKHLEAVIEHKLRKNEVGPVVYRETKRKVGGVNGVPTLLVAGPVGRIHYQPEFIPLDELQDSYPERWSLFMKYAALDAKLTLELYQCFRIALSGIAWRMAS